MIQGTVNASRLAMIDITFLSSEGIPNNYSAMIDTGFTGYLTLSPEIIWVCFILVDPLVFNAKLSPETSY